VYERHGLDPVWLSIRARSCKVIVLLCLQEEQADDDLEIVLDAVVDFLEEDLFLVEASLSRLPQTISGILVEECGICILQLAVRSATRPSSRR